MSLADPQAMQSIVNMDFLRSGAEFSPQSTRKGMKSTAATRKSKAARLEEFYNATRAVHDVKSDADVAAAASMDAWDGLSIHNAPATVPSIVNLDFLRSGHEFNSNGNPLRRDGHSNTASAPSPKTSKNSKLESFYNTTLKAFEGEHVRNGSGGHDLDCWDGLQCNRATSHMDVSTPSTADSVVNMEFLRSGGEFKSTPDDGMHVDGDSENEWTPRSRSSRLEDFYARTLAAHQHH